jgi:hypothetical protein
MPCAFASGLVPSTRGQENDTSLVLDGTKKAKKGAPESAHITKGEIGHKPKITNKEKLGLIQNPNGTGTALRA